MASVYGGSLHRQSKMKAWSVDSGFNLELVTPFLGKYRPFTGRCCQRCTPRSWESLFHKHLPSLGFCNVIKITEKNTRYRGWLVRRLCYILAVCDWKLCAETPNDFQKKILASNSVHDVVCQTGLQGKEDVPAASISVAQWTREIHRILCQIQASLSPFWLRLSHWTLLKLLNRMFLSVVVHKGQLEMVRKAAQVPDVPVVFLSTHKSHLDGLLIPFLLVSQGLGMPRVAWDCKTFTPKYRALLAHLGGVFLPEGVEQTQDSKDEMLSKAVLASYVEELLKSRQPLLIFLEETSGKKWLSLVVQAFHTGIIPDVMVVPIGVSYDMAPDLVHRGQWTPTQPISLWTSFWAICRAVYQRPGCVRVDFAQPLSLQEYITNSFSRQRCTGRCLEEILLPEILGKSSSMLDCEKLERWPKGLQSVVALDAEQEIWVDSLILHSLITGVSCSAIMAVEVMSALLLHKHQEGVLLSRLMQDFVWLTEEILLRNFDVGFSGRVRDVVLHALALLSHCITLHHLSVGDVLVTPKRTEAAVMELSQHSAAVLPIFIQEAVGACAVNALLMELLPYLGSPEQLREVVLVQEELSNKILLLVQLLQRDFLLCEPCQSVHSYCQNVIDKLIQRGFLVPEEVPSDVFMCDASRKRFHEKLLWKAADDFGDSDSDFGDDYGKRYFKVSQLESSCTLFVLICCLLSPLLKTLKIAAAFLGEVKGPQPESQYLENLHQFLVKKAKEDCYIECANRTLTSISIQIYKELGVLRQTAGQMEVILHLSDAFSAKENQEKLEKFISQFIYN